MIEEDGSGSGEEKVRAPDAQEGRQLAGLREGGADLREQVVDEDENDGDDEARGFASTFGGDAERDADEHEDETGEWIGEALVELDAVDGGLATVGGALGVGAAPEFGEREGFDVGIEPAEVGVFGGFGFDGNIGSGEGGDVVLVGVVGGGVMLASVDEVEADGLGVGGVRGSVDDDGLGGGGDMGVGGLCEVGEEDVVPESGSGGGCCVLNVEDTILELFVEDARLDLEGGLRGRERFAERDDAGGSAWGEIEGVEEAEGEGDSGDDGDDADEVDGAHAGGAHGGNFAVGSEA